MIENKSKHERIKITPPKLNDIHLDKKIICYRPLRRGSPNMSIEEIGDKVIAHNYGHGGGGWTLAPGSAVYVIDLLESASYSKNLNKKSSITIIGAGIIGLFIAYKLVQRGYENVIILAERFKDIASLNAGGLLCPISMNNDQSLQKIINKIGIDSYKFYLDIAENKYPIFKEGVVVLPAYFRSRQESQLESYVDIVLKPARDVILDFGNGTTRQMVVYDDSIFLNTSYMIKALTKYLKSRIKFSKKKVTSFKDVDSKFIINCSGFGSHLLNNDEKLIPVQGHLITLKNQKPKDLNYTLLVYLNEEENKHNQKCKRAFYIFPKKNNKECGNDIGVIGGTFIWGANDTTPNEEEFDNIIDNAKKFYGI
jgi:hypothetical protein